jgi:hypothetical protein
MTALGPAAKPTPPTSSLHAHAKGPSEVSLLYEAAACLVAAQLVGIYALVTRKADLIFSVFMVILVIAAVVLGVAGAHHQLG